MYLGKICTCDEINFYNYFLQIILCVIYTHKKLFVLLSVLKKWGGLLYLPENKIFIIAIYTYYTIKN